MRAALVGALMLCWPGLAEAAAGDVAARACATLAARVDAMAGSMPVFLASYDGAEDEPALAGAAFTYDNAVAVIALVACDRQPQALRIGEALLAATLEDRAGPQGRLRNAYRAGPQFGPPQPHGWWAAKAGRWAEDPMQVGTATGNVAWAGLALATLAEATGAPRFTGGAVKLARWIAANAADARGPGGFTGGVHGDGIGAVRLGWKSTEHNVDAAALFTRLNMPSEARAATRFVAAMWEGGHFLTGTLPDGTTPNRATSGLDAQLWPLLLKDAPAQWAGALDYALKAHGVGGGLDFNDDRDGIWWEGTAQGALAARAAGRDGLGAAMLDLLAGQFSPGGHVWATSTPRLTTGLALAPESASADFFYFRRPHLAATAWTALAARRWNPFTGRTLP